MLIHVYHMTSLLRRCSRYLWMVSALLALVDTALPEVVHAAIPIKVTTRFGELDEVHKVPHHGIDFALNEGTPIQSLTDGKVIAVLDEGTKSWGKSVHVLDSHGEEIIYGHLSKPLVHVGDTVHFKQFVALSGNTGQSTGPHLHIEVRINGKPIDPAGVILDANVRSALA